MFAEDPETDPDVESEPQAEYKRLSPRPWAGGAGGGLVLTHLGGHLAIIDPPQCGKVGGLGAVESVVEASMVAVGERDHELPRLLGDLRREE